MALIKNDRTGFPSLYRATYERGWNLKNLGFDYSKLSETRHFQTICLGIAISKSFWKIILALLWYFGLIELST